MCKNKCAEAVLICTESCLDIDILYMNEIFITIDNNDDDGFVADLLQ